MRSTALEASQSNGRGARPRKSLYEKLKPGPGRSSQEVFASQRARLRTAMIDLCAEHGYEAITLRDLTRLARVSTRSFYRHFTNAEECFVDTYESLMQSGLRRAYAAQRGSETWEQAICASLQSVLEDLASDPKAARLVLVEPFAVGPSMQPRMREAIAGFERLLGDNLTVDPQAPQPSRHIIGGIAAGVIRVARTRLLVAETADVDALTAELEDWMLSLLAGHETAVELRGPWSPATATQGSRPGNGTSPMLLGAIGDEQRRILSATLKLAMRGGFRGLTIPKIRAEAGVSRRSFDARFASVGECFLEAIEAATLAADSRVPREPQKSSDWERRVYRRIGALCTEAARNPPLAQLAFADIFDPGREGRERKERLVSLAAQRLRRTASPDRRPSQLLAEASAAAAWRIAHIEIATGRAQDLPRLAPTLTYVILASADATKRTPLSEIENVTGN